MYVTSHQCIVQWGEIASCIVRKIIHLFYVMVCVVRAEYKFYFRLVINKIPKNGDQCVQKLRYAVIETYDLILSVCFPRTVIASVKDSATLGRSISFS